MQFEPRFSWIGDIYANRLFFKQCREPHVDGNLCQILDFTPIDR
jgi:hypothetical protein